VIFVLVERRTRAPLVDLRLFAARDFDGALIANTVLNLVFAGLSILLTTYLQEVRGYSPMKAGLMLLPSTVTILALNPIGARWARRAGPRLPVIAGVAILGAGTLVAAGLRWYWVPPVGLLILGAGIGLLSTPMSDTAVAGPPEELAGTASGLFKATSMLGGALGVATMFALAQSFQGQEAIRRATQAGLNHDDANEIKRTLIDSKLFNEILGQLDPGDRPVLRQLFREVQTHGFIMALLVAGAVALLCAVLLQFVWPRRGPAGGPGPQPASQPAADPPAPGAGAPAAGTEQPAPARFSARPARR
jgi:MFS family permease